MAELESEEKQCCRRLPVGAIVAGGVAAGLSAAVISRARNRARQQAHEDALKALADEYGCEFVAAEPNSGKGPDFPSLSGMLRGRNVRIETEVAGRGMETHLLTRAVAAHTAPIGGFIVIREETLLTRIADHLGLADIEVGEPEFDKRFEIASDMDDAPRLLQPEVRDALLCAVFESVVLRDGEVIVRQRGPVADAETLRQTLKLAIDLAEWLEMLG